MENEPIIVSTQEQMFTEKQYVDKEIITKNETAPVSILPTRETNGAWIWQDDGINEVKVEFYDKDSITGNYKLSLVKEFEYEISENSDKNILEGYLLVPVELNGENKMYLRDISIPINLDLNLFGTNTLELSSWGFKASEYYDVSENGNNISKTKVTIRYNLNSYFSDETTWKELKLEYKDLTTANNNTDYSKLADLNSLGGQVTVELTARHIYQVKISYGVSYPDSTTTEQKSIDNLWILSTQLFNDCFNIGENYINNYCAPKEGREQEIFDELTTTKYYGEAQLQQNNSTLSSSTDGISYYNLFNPQFKYTIQNTYVTTNSVNITYKILNEENYPEDIRSILGLSVNNGELQLLDSNFNIELDNKFIEGNSYYDQQDFDKNINISLSLNNNSINSTIVYNDFFNGIAPLNIDELKMFVPIEDQFPYLVQKYSSKDLGYVGYDGGTNNSNVRWVVHFGGDLYRHYSATTVDDKQVYLNQDSLGANTLLSYFVGYPTLRDDEQCEMFIYNFENNSFSTLTADAIMDGGIRIPRDQASTEQFLYVRTQIDGKGGLYWGVIPINVNNNYFTFGKYLLNGNLSDALISLFPENSRIYTYKEHQFYSLYKCISNNNYYTTKIINYQINKDLNMQNEISVQHEIKDNTYKIFKLKSDKINNNYVYTIPIKSNIEYKISSSNRHLNTFEENVNYKNLYFDSETGKSIGSSINKLYIYTLNNNVYTKVKNVESFKIDQNDYVPVFKAGTDHYILGTTNGEGELSSYIWMASNGENNQNLNHYPIILPTIQ